MITDPERMEVILKKLELVYCEMQPGDILIMHGNTLHYSENNQTDRPRVLVVSHYNSADNEPYDLEGAEILRYRPLNKLPDSWIQDKKYDSVFIDKDFFNQQKTDDAELYAGVGNLEKRYSRLPNTRKINEMP